MNLILFFNGWGMDKNCISEIKIPINFCLQVVNFPYDYDVKNLKKYEKVYFTGWSFGAWYLSKFIIENEIKSQNVIGINGHGEIIGEYGIKEKMIALIPKRQENLKEIKVPDLKQYLVNGYEETRQVKQKNIELTERLEEENKNKQLYEGTLVTLAEFKQRDDENKCEIKRLENND